MCSGSPVSECGKHYGRGKAGPEEIAQLAQGRARKPIPEIVAALEEHPMSAHHRQMIRYSVEHMQLIEQQIIQLDKDIAEKIGESGLPEQWELTKRAWSAGHPRCHDSGRNGDRNAAVWR